MKQTVLLVRLALLLGLLGANIGTTHATPPAPPPLPPPIGSPLSYWNFNDTNWLTSLGNSPLVFTNILNVPSWNGNAVEIDHGQPAGIQYRIIESSGHTNLTLNTGTLRFWFKPNWTSTNLGGFGPGNFARLIDVGTYTTNATYGWWGLYFDPEGTVLSFAGQTNGAEAIYLSSQIAWASNDWHLLTLTYSATNSALYLDDQLATNGLGVTCWPGADILTNGFLIGTDSSGMAQARGQFEDLKTFDYPLTASAVSQYYQAVTSRFLQLLNGNFNSFSTESGPPLPGDEEPGGGPPSSTNDLPPVVYGTNDFYLEILLPGTNAFNLDTNSATLILHGTAPDISYQILSKPALTNGPWTVEQNLLGAPDQNWTPTTVSMTNRPTMFFKALAYTLDSDGDGLPDWYELEVTSTDPNNPDTGNTGTPDGYKDLDNDGWSNLEEYQNGTQPTSFNTPPPPHTLTAQLDSTGTNVVLKWISGGGPVTSYAIVDADGTEIGTVNASTFTFTDNPDYQFVGVPGWYQPGYPPSYSIRAYYSNGNPTQSTKVAVRKKHLSGMLTVIRGAFGQPYIALESPPADLSHILLIYSIEEEPYFSTKAIYATNLISGIAKFPLEEMVGFEGLWSYQLITTNGNFGDQLFATFYAPEDVSRSHKYYSFVDARHHIKENLKFLLRSATINEPFSYSCNLGRDGRYEPTVFDYYVWDPNTHFARPPTALNYEYSGFHVFSFEDNYSLLSDSGPIQEHYLWQNFIYNPTNFGPSGTPPDEVQYSSGWPNLRLLVDPTNQFIGVASNSPPADLVFNNTNSMWFYARHITAPFLAEEFSELGVLKNSSGEVYLPTGLRNLYGLPIISARLHQDSSITNFILLAGGSPQLPGGSGVDCYLGVGEPNLQTVEYYFASQSASILSDGIIPRPPVPGSPDFSITNTSPLIIASVGQPITVAGWAKQAIVNGYSNKFAYLEQYFDKAYKMDVSGNVTTNETGILSPYGEFFPTEPGPVALVSMPDIDTGQRGTGTVQVIKLQLDVNHDGDMDLSFSGPDNTSAARPFKFWVNNDYDRLHEVDGDQEEDDLKDGRCPYTPRISTPDCEYRNTAGDRVIPSLRDLEDFARLWLSGISTNLFANLPPDVTAELSWGDKGNPNTNNPTIDIFGTPEPDGGIGYLTNFTTSWLQTNNSHIGIRLGPGDSIPVVYTNSSGWQYWNHAIWCGVKAGSGILTLTFNQGTNKIAESSAYIEVKDVKQMYERWTVGDNGELPPVSQPYLAKEGLPAGVPPFQYGPLGGTNASYILLVPDYDLPTWKEDRYAETAFKRLYWQGYQGGFGLFRWPGVTNSIHPLDDSEFKSWKSGTGLLSLLNQLNSQYSGSVYLMAHGYGAFAAGEALRLSGTNTVVKRYIAMQGAVPSHAYDPFAPFRSLGGSESGTPNLYWSYYTNGAPPYFSGVGGASAYINYFNTNDFVLTNSWRETEDTKPDLGYHWNGTNFSSGFLPPYTLLLFPVDTYEIFSYCVEARCEAIGAQPNLGGPFLGQPNLDLTTLNVRGIYADHHSGQFKSSIADVWPFWYTVLKSMGLKQ